MYTEKQLKESGLDDFRVFLAQGWDHLQLPEPTPVQYRIAWWLQHGPRRMVLQAFRGVGKSWITVLFCLWNLFKDPEKKIEMVSASQQLADDSAKFAHQLIHSWPLLGFLKPGGKDRQSALAFDVGPAKPSKDPSLKSAGITGQVTGTRADIIIADDIEIPENSFTHHRREKLAEKVKEFDAILKPGGRVIFLGTPHVEQSLYKRLTRERGYETRIWPAEIPEDTSPYHGNLAPYVTEKIESGQPPGTPLDPDRFDAADLAERRASFGPTGYALQFMLDTTPADIDKHPLRTRDLIVHDCDSEQAHLKLVWGSGKDETIEDLPSAGFDGDYWVRPAWRSEEMVPYQGTVMAIDPSGRGKDETAYAIVRYCEGMLYLVDVGGFVDGYADETLRTLAAKMARHGVNRYVAEDNYGGGMFTKVLKPWVAKLANATHDDDWNAWATGKKEWRILDTLEPVVHSHRLVVDRKVVEEDLKQAQRELKYSWVHQMTRMARMKDCLPHEDRLEAVAMAVGYWTDKMDAFHLDENEAVQEHKAKALDEELRNWHHHVHIVGARDRAGAPRRNRWTGHRRRR